MTYRIVRRHFDYKVGVKVIKTGLTLSEAMDHCNDPETSSSHATTAEAKAYTEKFGLWFDSYEHEEE